MKTHAAVKVAAAEILEVRHGERRILIVEADHDLLELFFLADADLHDRDLRPQGLGVRGGEKADDKRGNDQMKLHSRVRGNSVFSTRPRQAPVSSMTEKTVSSERVDA